MRYIAKDYNNPIARAQLESTSCNQDVCNSVQVSKGKYQKAKFGHKIVRDQLRLIYHDKCCYCESSIRPVSTPHIEHFRPQKAITEVNKKGYYWLGYEWTNLLLACPTCNGIKSTKFPILRNNHLVTHPQDINQKIDFTKFSIDSDFYKEERPLIINPERINPEKLFYIDYFCYLIPVKNNRLAKTTIKEIKLNRNDLVAARQKYVNNIIDDIEEQLRIKYSHPGLTDLQFKIQLEIIFKKIIVQIYPTEEYTMLGRNMIERFDELILEDIEPAFRKEIYNLFVRFLKQI